MGVGKKAMVLWICAMVVMEHVAMGRNVQMQCPRLPPPPPPPSNEYNRGRETSQRCGRKLWGIVSLTPTHLHQMDFSLSPILLV
ncbi:hypothetical protein V6N13_027103 [Hibiscus sabdariffa]